VLTGRGADILIIDDPLKPEEALSDAQRQACNEWYDHTLYSRQNNKRLGAIIIIMLSRDAKFARDSPLEGDGFELSVPRQIESGSAPVRPNGAGSTGPTQGRYGGIVDLGGTSDHQLASDTAYVHLEFEPLHRRAREMPRQTARDSSAADELVGHERMDVKDRIDLGCGHIRPAEAERRHTLFHRPEHETRFLAHRLGRVVAASNNAPFIAGATLARFAASGSDNVRKPPFDRANLLLYVRQIRDLRFESLTMAHVVST